MTSRLHQGGDARTDSVLCILIQRQPYQVFSVKPHLVAVLGLVRWVAVQGDK